MAASDLYIVISIDTDEDTYDKNVFQGAEIVTWKGVEEGIPKILSELAGYTDGDGHAIKYTWFVRCDRQLQEIFGDPAHFYRYYRELWRQRAAQGDEIAWHPHLYEHDLNARNSEEQIILDLHDCYRAARSTGSDITTSRIGRSFCSNGVVRTLQNLGIKIDSTAMPGRKRKDRYNSIDWEPTPGHPYHPSKLDYRVPGADAFSLLEAPMSMIETKASYDAQPISRYVNLTFKNDIIRNSLLKHLERCDLLITIMHPAEVLPMTQHPLLSFSIDEVKRNLDTILDKCRIMNRTVRFITMRDVLTVAAKGFIHVAQR